MHRRTSRQSHQLHREVLLVVARSLYGNSTHYSIPLRNLGRADGTNERSLGFPLPRVGQALPLQLVGGRLAVPSVYIAAEPGRVGQALPLHPFGDRVAQSGKLLAGVAPTFRSAPERHLRFCDPEAATAKSSLKLTEGSSSKERPTVTRGRQRDTVATRSQSNLLSYRGKLEGCNSNGMWNRRMIVPVKTR
jgi:hypothetical protein